MKRRIISLSLLAAVTLALSLAAVVSERASAQCSSALAGGIPCANGGGGGDKQKKPTPTDTNVPRPTSTPAAACVASTPDAAQLQTLCAGLLPAGGAGAQSTGVGSGQPDPQGSPTGPTGFLPYLLGGLGGLVLGLAIIKLRPELIVRFLEGDPDKPLPTGGKGMNDTPKLLDNTMQSDEGISYYFRHSDGHHTLSDGTNKYTNADGGGPNPGGHPATDADGGGPNPGSKSATDADAAAPDPWTP